MVDEKIIGKALPRHTAKADPTRLRFFAEAIGETSPIYTDAVAARAAGLANLPLPPTFLFCLDTDARDDATWLQEIGISYPHVLHAGQSFTYHRMAYADDTLHFETNITDTYTKRDGELRFVELTTHVTDQDGRLVADMITTVVEHKQRSPK